MKKNIKLIFGIIIGLSLGLIISTKASTLLNAKDIFYDNSKTGLTADVNSALDETYSKVENLQKRVTTLENSKLTLDEVYPVGSIYISTTDDTKEKVQNKFGGTWEVYSSGRTLVGNDGSTYKAGNTGGSSTVKLTNSNLPSHSHVIPSLSGNTGTSGAHRHSLKLGVGSDDFIVPNRVGAGSSSFANSGNTTQGHWFSGSYIADTAGEHSHTLTTNESNTTTCTNCNNTEFSVQNPYTVVYMYKRIS